METMIDEKLILNNNKRERAIRINNLDTRDSDDSSFEEGEIKRSRVESVLPVGFLDPLTPEDRSAKMVNSTKVVIRKQLWKAGDYEGDTNCGSSSYFGGMDHLRVHPKFLHSKATSNKWALGAFAELLDNAWDEADNRATRVIVHVLNDPSNTDRMLLFEDDGGMTPEKMHYCMSLG